MRPRIATLISQNRVFLTSALMIAAEKYERDAKRYPGAAERLHKLAQKAKTLADLIGDAGSLSHALDWNRHERSEGDK